MSIVRVGLAETNKFAEGYEAIFGKKKVAAAKPAKKAAPKAAKGAKAAGVAKKKKKTPKKK